MFIALPEPPSKVPLPTCVPFTYKTEEPLLLFHTICVQPEGSRNTPLVSIIFVVPELTLIIAPFPWSNKPILNKLSELPVEPFPADKNS